MNFLSKLRQLSGKMRIAIIASILWLLFVGLSLATYEYSFGPSESGVRSLRRYYGHGEFHLYDFMLWGVLPLVIIWGIWWIREGFRKKPEKEKDIDK